MGHRPAIQKAVDHIAEGRVHAGRRPRMGPPQTEGESDQLHLWGNSGRLHVLADRQTPFRLVLRTGLRLQFCRRPPALHRYERRSPHRNSMISTQRRTHQSWLNQTQARALSARAAVGLGDHGRVPVAAKWHFQAQAQPAWSTVHQAQRARPYLPGTPPRNNWTNASIDTIASIGTLGRLPGPMRREESATSHEN